MPKRWAAISVSRREENPEPAPPAPPTLRSADRDWCPTPKRAGISNRSTGLARPPASPSGFVHPANVTAVPADYFAALESLRDKLKAEPELVIVFDDSFKGDDVRKLVDFGESLGIPVKYVCLVDYSNSRGAVDMGVMPELLPGYQPSGQPGMHTAEMVDADLDVLWVVGANPLKRRRAAQGGLPRGAGHVPHRDRGSRPMSCCPPPSPTKRTARSPTLPAKCSA